ncbi:AAA family ATPase [Streptomyces sp. NPDC051133]|uniref:helix-turn-helix transcriptional regulator n=1 Tax=Streptomyces sp. NPDC051133 TaxID=3155521 RepID=UPI00343FA1E9
MMLVERDRHLTQLSGLLEDCLHGAGSVVVVRGPVAVGKTELLHTFAERVAGPRVRFLSAAAAPAEQHLALGLVGQLLHGADPGCPERAEAALGAGVRADGRAGPRVPQEVARVLLDMSADQPLLIGVDDVYHADPDSLQCLLFLARRLRRSRIMLVLTDQDRSGSGRPGPHTELSRHPYGHQIRLDPLTCDGVAALLAQELDAHAAHSLAAAAAAVTRGNPLLVRALAADWEAAARTPGREPPRELVVHHRFAERVVTCLHRLEPGALTVARAVAVLGEPSGADPVARLSGLGRVETGALLELLDEAGVLTRGRYRHPVARAAVLRDLAARERVDWHRRAARLLHADGGRPTAIADHLLAAGSADEPWASAVLQESAASATAGGELDFALDCLELAHTLADDEQERAMSRAVLAEAEWRIDPARAVRHLGQLTDAGQRGLLPGRHALATLEYLLWHGRPDEAATALTRIAAAHDACDAPAGDTGAGAGLDAGAGPGSGAGPGTGGGPGSGADPVALGLPAFVGPAELDDVRACLELCYPGRRRSADTGAGAVGPSLVRAALDAVRGVGGAVGEHVWQGLRPRVPLSRLALGLLALARPERLLRDAPWCLPLLEDAAGSDEPHWPGLLTAARADAALLRGDLPAAAGLASAALSEHSRSSWGVLIGAPLACLLTVAVETGRFEEAAAQLAMPVPGALLQTPFGLRYLLARGHYHLAVDRPYAALSDFQTCGQLLREWADDGPWQLPWRIDAAQALLRLGRRAEAHTLLGEQLDGPAADDPVTLGRALRQLAAAVEPHERPALLGDAVEALQTGGDRLELAHALADLALAHHAVGDSRRARPALRRAWRAARECHADRLVKSLLPGLPDRGPGPAGGGPAALDEERAADLSAAEYRVGSLAAQGHSNRQIAQRLCITVSTVEQHLTQVYRKLGVRSRTDLPVFLQVDDTRTIMLPDPATTP